MTPQDAGLRVIRGWHAGDHDLMPAVRKLYEYGEREPDRATGWLWAARQIGTLAPMAWPEPLALLGPALLSELEAETGISFEAACFQAYLDGSGCGWHHDRNWDAQAIVSLGVTRGFGLRHDDGSEFWLQLAHGDLLVMPPGFQDEWEHGVLPEDVTGERCSLVFRSVSDQLTT